ncbi:MAG: hypothetical protein HOP25_06780 [Methylotenera sp.]|nr:hypothetical protein [Methylotenera sp.]
MPQLLIFIHIISVIVWIGGMFFAYFCLRPAAVEVLEPPKRLPLWLATFKLFFRYAAIAVTLILTSGFVMFLQVGFKAAPMSWHIMLTLGLIMSFVFAYVVFVLYPKLHTHCEASAWPAAGATLGSIRQLVAVNLALSVLTIAAAVLGR